MMANAGRDVIFWKRWPWLNIKWYDSNNSFIREDGAYGTLTTIVNQVDGIQYALDSINNLHASDTKIYESHYAMTQE